jgi:hypothetical protein
MKGRLWVRPGKARAEQNESALPRAADTSADSAGSRRRANSGLTHRNEFDHTIGMGEQRRAAETDGRHSPRTSTVEHAVHPLPHVGFAAAAP